MIATSNACSEGSLPVAEVCRKLKDAYGQPRLGNPKNAVDDLIFIVISNKTSPIVASKTFRRLKDAYQTWDDLLRCPLAKLRSVLKPAGLSNIKSGQLRRALRMIRHDFGACDLTALKDRPLTLVHEYLTSLPGVSDKVSKCVMMYTLGARVLPVDAHVHRISKRLGWTTRKRADQCHEELESLVSPQWRYAFHVDCILHGRTICRPRAPRCDACCINQYCQFFRVARQNA